jgi:3-phenylpropionate/trans-cinnamate dioxygenase ferredoxin reductase subunit
MGVILSDGSQLPADLVMIGVGVLANDDLALEAGLKCEDGVVVNGKMETSEPTIFAIGDCAQFPFPLLATSIRLESVQNAVDQARYVAKRLMGSEEDYAALPWFWSDQGDLKLQIAGLSHYVDQWVIRGEPQSRSFSVFGFRGTDLAVVETVNRSADHMIARRMLATRAALKPEQAWDVNFDLRKFATAHA